MSIMQTVMALLRGRRLVGTAGALAVVLAVGSVPPVLAFDVEVSAGAGADAAAAVA